MPFLKCFPCLKFRQEEAITKLDFSNTALADVFPDVWQHERTLEELILSSTRITALPPQLFYCQSLRSLVVNNNGLESIPNAVGSLRQLQHINLSRNLISSVPNNIKSCKNLTHLDLSCNNLQRLPDAITCLISLQELLLNEAYLEFLPANFGRLVNLQVLELRLNNLITLPKSMARLGNLQRIDIGGNEFTELPEVVGELKSLLELWIDFNQIRRMSPNVGNLRDLKHLEANGNLIESLPNEVSNWRHIEVLSISTSNLETLPFSVGMMKSLVTLKCESNQLRELPDSICNLENLEELVVSHNQLIRLPTTIGLLRKLRFIFVDDNELRTLPDEICMCSQLSVLSVNRNMLTELPQNIGHLSNLKVLNVVSNCITTLPVSVLSLINLTSLWISDNQSQPLVPLQYSDTNTKLQLTCFMLPQLGVRLPQQHNRYGNDVVYPQNSINEEATTSQENGMDLYEMSEDGFANSYNARDSNGTGACSSPSRHICFAKEATIMASTPTAFEQIARDDTRYPLSSAMAAPLANRLMRSPTPYPKELRLMSKYVRNNQKLTHKNPQLSHIKEARVMTNFFCDTNTSSVDEIQDYNHCQSNNSGTYDIIPLANNTFQPHSQPISCQNHSTQPYFPTYTADAEPSLGTLYDSSNQQTYLENKSQPQLLTSSQLMQQLRPDYNTKYEIRPPYVVPPRTLLEPPPYHIARVFTKMSPEDLTNYDTLRNQQNLCNESCQSNTVINQHLSCNLSKSTTITIDAEKVVPNLQNNSNYYRSRARNGNCLNDDNYDQQTPISVVSLTNQKASLTNPQSGENVFNTNEVINDPDISRQFNADGAVQNGPTTTSQYKENTIIGHSNGNNCRNQGANKKTPWLFGVHKNPTVKQVTISWENDVGFDIKKINNEDGIFVASITPNTSASSLLLVHDKLLEVDGLDFNNISIVDARNILSNASPLVNIMLSRK